MLDFSYNLDSVFSHELCKSAFSDGIFWDSGVEPLFNARTPFYRLLVPDAQHKNKSENDA